MLWRSSDSELQTAFPDPFQRMCHPQHARCKVDVLPPKPDDLTAA